jgi:hypothetical protein
MKAFLELMIIAWSQTTIIHTSEKTEYELVRVYNFTCRNSICVGWKPEIGDELIF